MKILDRSGLRRPVALRPLPGHPPGARPRRARGVADRQAGPGVRRRAARGAARASPSTAARTASPAASCGACARTRAPGSATCSSTSRSSCRTSRRAASRSARRAARDGRRASTRRLRVRAARRRRRGRPSSACGCWLAAAAERCGPSTSRSSWSGRSARRVHPLRAAPGARPLDRVAGARRRGRDIPWLRLNDQSLSSSATASTSSASRPPSPARRRTSRSSSRPTRRRPTRSSATLGLPVPRQQRWCRATRRPCAPRAHRLPGRDQAATTATTAAASRSA